MMDYQCQDQDCAYSCRICGFILGLPPGCTCGACCVCCIRTSCGSRCCRVGGILGSSVPDVQEPAEADEFFDAYRASFDPKEPRYLVTEAGLAALKQLEGHEGIGSPGPS